MEARCPECGEVAAEPRLRYCENCGAKMPEYKPPPLVDEQAAAAAAAKARPARPPYNGPLWLAPVPAHSPTVLGVILHMVAMGLSILPNMAGLGPFWSFVMVMGGLLVVAREYRRENIPNVFLDWVPESYTPSIVPTLYAALAIGFLLPMMEFSFQPLLWIPGTVLVAGHQWDKVFTDRGGLAAIFDPLQLGRGARILALVGVFVCMLALFFTWKAVEAPAVTSMGYLTAQDRIRPINMPRPPADSVYLEAEPATSGMELPVGATIQVGLLAILMLLMIRPQVDRPVWLRFVPMGITVIALAWVLVNMRMKVGPILFLVGLVPILLISLIQMLGRDDLDTVDGYADAPAAAAAPQGEEHFVEENSVSLDNFPTEPAGDKERPI
jgi:hypothetical protein